MRFLTLVLSLVLAVGITTPAPAQMPPLDPARIEKFLAALPELRSLSYHVDGDPPPLVDPMRPFSPLITAIGTNNALAEASLIAAKHGFASFADWAETGNRTMQAFATANAAADLGDAAGQIAAAVEQIRTDSDLTPEQQDLMLRQLEQATGTVLRFNASPQDIAAVDPYMTKLRNLFQ